ncbi:MAG: segregation and condensation protein A [Nocardioides sp.]
MSASLDLAERPPAEPSAAGTEQSGTELQGTEQQGTENSPAEPARDFSLRLDNFEGPFDLLLSLIAKHKLDVTEVALSKVTDEFLAFVREAGPAHDLEQTTSFLVMAATLLDLKAARLLPQGDVEDEEDLALLEARDLLFARLLQYRAFKQVAGVLESRLDAEASRHPRAVGLEDRFAQLLPEVLIGIGLDQFADLASRALAPKPAPEVPTQHIHAPAVSVREQGVLVVDRLRRHGAMSFRSLCGDSPDLMTTVARFLALLELFREGAVGFEQLTPLGELTVRWTGSSGADFEIADEFEGTPLPVPVEEEK